MCNLMHIMFRVTSDHNQAVVDALSNQIVLSGKFTDEYVISGKAWESDLKSPHH